MADKHYQRALEQVADLEARLLAAERERDEAVLNALLNAHSYASQILEAQVAANEAEREARRVSDSLADLVSYLGNDKLEGPLNDEWRGRPFLEGLCAEARAALKGLKADNPPTETRGG
jgi:hypothetical protein